MSRRNGFPRAEEPLGRRVDRQTALKWAVLGVGAAITGGVAVPIVGYFVSPLIKRQGASIPFTPLGSVRDFEVNSPRTVDFMARIQDGWTTVQRDRAVWVVRRGESDFWVYNPHCTHLGCAYHWDDTKQRFLCPCHGGVFTIDGTVVAGPPPRPLDTLEWKMQNDVLLVQYQDFTAGTAKKQPY